MLEEAFHVCDLLYGYMDRFEHPEGIPEVLKAKEKLSLAIMKILEKQELAGRRCRECGRPLPWNYMFGVCERCHHGGRRRGSGSGGNSGKARRKRSSRRR
jgi:ATP-dependent RNA helicase SUPV3L1/SUV3